MARVECEVSATTVEYRGRDIPGVCVTCGQCGREEVAGGEERKSILRCLAQLRENCEEEGEDNYYFTLEDDDE